VHRDHPAFARLTGADCVSLPTVRAAKWTEEEKAFAQAGWQPTQRVAVKPTAHPPIQEGGAGVFQAEADGVPYPAYQWYELELGTRQPKPLKGQTNPRLEVRPQRGVARYRVEAFNRANGGQRASAEVSIEVRAAFNAGRTGVPKPASPAKRNAGLVRIDDDDDEAALRRKQRNVQQAEEIGRVLREKQNRNHTIKWMAVPTAILAIFALALVGWKLGWFVKEKGPAGANGTPTKQSPPVAPPESSPPTNAAKASQPGAPTGAVSASTSPAITNPAPAVDSSQVPSNAASATPSPAPHSLPAGWQAVVIGDLSLPPDVSSPSNRVFLVTGAGTSLTGKTDNLSFVFRSASFDEEFTARFAGSNSGTLDAPQDIRLGIMMRDSQEKGAPFVFVGVSSSYSLLASRKEFDTLATEIDKPGVPTLFKLTRAGNHFKGSCLYSGAKQWASFGEVTFSPMFSVGDLKDAASLAVKLKHSTNSMPSYIRGRLKDSTRRNLKQWQRPEDVPLALQKSVIADLNAIIGGSSIWDTNLFKKVEIRQETRHLLEPDPPREYLALVNRLLLDDAFPQELRKMNLNYLVGLVVCSGRTNRTVMARFEDVKCDPQQNKRAPQAGDNSGK
jgi:hypothetical protein